MKCVSARITTGARRLDVPKTVGITRIFTELRLRVNRFAVFDPKHRPLSADGCAWQFATTSVTY